MGSVTISLEDFDKIKSKIDKMGKDAQKVIDRTLGDFRQRGPGWVSQEVVKEYNIKKGEASKGGDAGTVRVNASADNISIEYKGRPLTPIHFSLTPKQGKGFKNGKTLVNAAKLNIKDGRTPPAAYAAIPRKYKVNMTVKKGQKKQIAGKHNTPVFLGGVTKGSSKMIPFQRIPGTDKLEAIRSVSLPQMVDNDTVQENISQAIDEKLGKRFDHYAKMYLGK